MNTKIIFSRVFLNFKFNETSHNNIKKLQQFIKRKRNAPSGGVQGDKGGVVAITLEET